MMLCLHVSVGLRQPSLVFTVLVLCCSFYFFFSFFFFVIDINFMKLCFDYKIIKARDTLVSCGKESRKIYQQ